MRGGGWSPGELIMVTWNGIWTSNLNTEGFLIIFFVGMPHTAAYIFSLFSNEPEMGTEINPGMFITLFLSSILGRDLNPQPCDHESKSLTTRPDWRPCYSQTYNLCIRLYTFEKWSKITICQSKMDFLSANSRFAVQNDWTYLPRITKETCVQRPPSSPQWWSL